MLTSKIISAASLTCLLLSPTAYADTIRVDKNEYIEEIVSIKNIPKEEINHLIEDLVDQAEEKLYDNDSAKWNYTNIIMYKTVTSMDGIAGRTNVVCGITVNAKNRYNAFVGYKPVTFYAITQINGKDVNGKELGRKYRYNLILGGQGCADLANAVLKHQRKQNKKGNK